MKMNKFDKDKVILEAQFCRSMNVLAIKIGMSNSMLRYNLGKARCLDLVKKIIEESKGKRQMLPTLPVQSK